jgi:hypothetical protein
MRWWAQTARTVFGLTSTALAEAPLFAPIARSNRDGDFCALDGGVV